MNIYNTLAKKIEKLSPINEYVGIYSCGPTVYDRAHIGNLTSFIYADTLSRVLRATDHEVKHVMNYTDIDDKTIRRSNELYPDKNPTDALNELTNNEINHFLSDSKSVGIDIDNIQFIRATDSIKNMQNLIIELINKNIAYKADDGIYFSISNYVKSGHKYGQLSNISIDSTSEARINNDEYDKDSVHDFALWKYAKSDEPSWEFIINNSNLKGRPGWHIECSAMSTELLGQPFDIHTGGIDLIFPHHENEIAQSTATKNNKKLANIFMHNEHLLVENKKMSKSLNNFYTIKDVVNKNYDPLSLRLLTLQAHYRSILHFSWHNLEAAQNRLHNYQAMADLRWQTTSDGSIGDEYINSTKNAIIEALQNDLNTPKALSILSEFEKDAVLRLIDTQSSKSYDEFVKFLDIVFGFNLLKDDINQDIKKLIGERETARRNADFNESDKIRDKLIEKNIGLRDTDGKTIWYRL